MSHPTLCVIRDLSGLLKPSWSSTGNLSQLLTLPPSSYVLCSPLFSLLLFWGSPKGLPDCLPLASLTCHFSSICILLPAPSPTSLRLSGASCLLEQARAIGELWPQHKTYMLWSQAGVRVRKQPKPPLGRGMMHTHSLLYPQVSSSGQLTRPVLASLPCMLSVC